ncbi:hypothetical protein STRTUCAR8_00909, partial [Streptomyces turgidiscabies Car8]
MSADARRREFRDLPARPSHRTGSRRSAAVAWTRSTSTVSAAAASTAGRTRNCGPSQAGSSPRSPGDTPAVLRPGETKAPVRIAARMALLESGPVKGLVRPTPWRR